MFSKQLFEVIKKETVLKNGTQAMIKAKKKGENTYFIYWL